MKLPNTYSMDYYIGMHLELCALASETNTAKECESSMFTNIKNPRKSNTLYQLALYCTANMIVPYISL